jgi:hypothetical protein
MPSFSHRDLLWLTLALGVQGGLLCEWTSAQQPVGSFEQAKEEAIEAVQEWKSQQDAVGVLSPRLAGEGNAKVRADLQKQLDDAAMVSAKGKGRARDCLIAAIDRADPQVSHDDLNLMRYLLCYLKHSDGDDYGAIVLGEFVAKRFPKHKFALPCAKIALASRMSLFIKNQDNEKKFESEGIVEAAKYIIAQWPNTPEAKEASKTLARFK